MAAGLRTRGAYWIGGARRDRVRIATLILQESANGQYSKTQLAIEYGYRVREKHPERWVFWVHASSAARFYESYKSIAQQVQLTGWNEPKADILGIVRRWLSDEHSSGWTMVVDNADSASVMFEPWSGKINLDKSASVSASHSLADYLPSSTNGSIVITTRNRKVTEGLIEYADDILDVEPMSTEEAVVLFMKKLKKQGQDLARDGLEDLARELDYMPLAMSQAALYINQRAPRVTVSKYLKELCHGDRNRAQLLQVDIRDPRRDGQASNSILSTWYMSFEHLRQTHQSAARLLSFMSLFDREGIPDYLLRGRYVEEVNVENEREKTNKNQRMDNQNEIDFEDDIATLRAYGLIGVGVSEQVFDMHRLVQFSTKAWLKLHDKLERWQRQYVNVLGEAFPTGDYANWRTCQALFPHIEAMVAYRVDSIEYRTVWAAILYRGSWYASASGRYGVAERISKASLETYKEVCGLEHMQTLDGMGMVALVLRYQGKYEQAEEMNRRALTGSEKALGVDHPSTLASVSNLAGVLQYQGKYEQAEEMNRRALTGREKALGVDHPSTLASVSNLALVLQDQRKYEQAEEMNRRALTGREKALGVDHPDTLTSVSNLAGVLQDQRKYEQAEEMNRRALTGSEKALGVDHPDTLTSVNNLAGVLQYQGKYEQAEEMNRRALTGSEKALGVDHPDTLTSVSNLAGVLQDQGKYEQAEEMNRRALTGREKALGVDHPSTLASVSNLAGVLQDQGKYEQAEEMNRRALTAREKALGVDHPSTLASVSNLAGVLQYQGKYEQAEEMNRRALTGREKALGVDHPSTLASVSNLAGVLQYQGKYEQAEEMNRRALTGSEKALGVDHPSTLTSVYCLADLLDAKQNRQEALKLYHRAVDGYAKRLGPAHPITQACQKHRASLLDKMSRSNRTWLPFSA